MREIQLQDLACLAMWACFDDTTSDDDEHSTSNAFLLLCGDALVAPVLLSGLTKVDELSDGNIFTVSAELFRCSCFLIGFKASGVHDTSFPQHDV